MAPQRGRLRLLIELDEKACIEECSALGHRHAAPLHVHDVLLTISTHRLCTQMLTLRCVGLSYTRYPVLIRKGTAADSCNVSGWPHVAAVCGECTVEVRRSVSGVPGFGYKTCHEFCATQDKTCVGAWVKLQSGQCNPDVQAVSCDENVYSMDRNSRMTNQAICRCSSDGQTGALAPFSETHVYTYTHTYAYTYARRCARVTHSLHSTCACVHRIGMMHRRTHICIQRHGCTCKGRTYLCRNKSI